MNNETHQLSKDDIIELLSKDDETIRQHIASIVHTADINEFFRQVDIDEWPRLLNLIDDEEQRAEVVFGFDRDEWKKLLPLLSPKQIASVLRELETDDAADLLADVPMSERFEALRLLGQKERIQVQQLLRYPEDSAGGIMQLELAWVDQDASVIDAINVVRQLVEDDVEVLQVWVVDQERRLVGTLALVDLLLNKATKKVSAIMDTDIVSVKPLVDQEEVALIFKKYDLLSLPVVDDNNRLLGRIVVDDVVDVLAEEAEEDALHMAGTTTEELLHQTAVVATARVRLPWLGVALGCSLISGLILHLFQPTVQKAVVILSFLPVITAMGGNVGTQSATLLIRGFGTGKFDLSHVPLFLYKELRVGLLMGMIYGAITGLTAVFVLTDQNWYLGMVVFMAMTMGMMTASIMGVIAPALLKRFDFDPAIASGPFVTTLNDITGVLIYMVIATIFLDELRA